MSLAQIASLIGIAGLLVTLVGSIISANGVRTTPPKGAPKPSLGEVNLYIDAGPVRKGLFAIAAGTVMQIISVAIATWLSNPI